MKNKDFMWDKDGKSLQLLQWEGESVIETGEAVVV